METEEEMTSCFQNGLLQWYEFPPDSKILYIGSSHDGIAKMLGKITGNLTCMHVETFMEDIKKRAREEHFQYIISVADLEKVSSPIEFLEQCGTLLQENGRLFLGLNNRLGLRYFCGDRDPYTNRVFDGIENYRDASTGRGRMYSLAEAKHMLQEAGWDSVKYYTVLPDLNHPFLLYAEDFLPNESMGNRVFPVYNNPSTVFLREEGIYSSLIDNGMFHSMANAYLFECSASGCMSDVLHVTSSIERGRENALVTITHANGTVEKRAIYQEGRKRLEELARHHADLMERGIPVIMGELESNRYVMPFIRAETGQVYLERLLAHSKDEFLHRLDHFRDLILQSSEQEGESSVEEIILKNGYVDMVPLNSFYVEGDFQLYDQEFCIKNIPANMIVWRMIGSFYGARPDLQKDLPMSVLCERYGLSKRLEHWKQMENDFISSLRRENELSGHYKPIRCEESSVQTNRNRINYSDKEYRKRFVETFENVRNRRLILFGSGRFFEQFQSEYGRDYVVHAVVDNDDRKWGTKIEDIEIQSPEILRGMEHGTYYVIVCIKECAPIMEQLEEMGVFAYCVFEPSRAYRRKRHPVALMNDRPEHQKKFHVGYVAGVFDLFHIGHLNLFRRAKEQCDYLIVGVVTDQQAREGKGVDPFIPFEERIEMVRSCRYVDEAREIPHDHPDTDMAWRMYRFDVQFSGSDYADDPVWLSKKKFLEERGATLVFFPYTESTSSTKLKELIERKLV